MVQGDDRGSGLHAANVPFATCEPHGFGMDTLRARRHALCPTLAYNARVPGTTNAKVSHRGQMSLPADLRHRWGLDDGGDLGVIDLGDAALIVSGGIAPARAELRRVLAERYDDGLSMITNAELTDQPA
ncbi:MAG: AbrB/MazE/SpoVT family DNA-binding domain-containing protein [Ilumatobacteraceae bacterium]